MTESVCRLLEERGHLVERLRNVLPTNSPDPIVAAYAERTNAILISHDGDFKRIAPRIPAGARARFARLSRIHLQLKHPNSAVRMAAALGLIEFEWAASLGRKGGQRIYIVIQPAGIKTHR